LNYTVKVFEIQAVSFIGVISDYSYNNKVNGKTVNSEK